MGWYQLDRCIWATEYQFIRNGITHWARPFAYIGVLTIILSACGGGSSGSKGISVSSPAVFAKPEREALSFGPSFVTEYERQSGLAQVQAASAYDDGYAGFHVKLAVVDTGVDGTHSELDGITSGHDFHGANSLSDPDGHGTHVASLIAAKRDGVGMHGIAPYADVTSYRIFDDDGTFGDKRASVVIPDLVSRAKADDVMLLNNSWSSPYEITDFDASGVRGALGAELDAWQDAVAAGMVMVWSAGNDGDAEVSVRAGLPHYYDDLKQGWLAVVSVAPDGSEPAYTNRCGIARQWCITAPGGGVTVSRDGVYGAKSGGGYERRSGTSMSAPIVTGALALVGDAFPELTSNQIVTRLLETAHYDGLITSDGCTIESCTEDEMAEVFGQGLLSVEDALVPIGTLSLTASTSPIAVTEPILDGGIVIDEALFSAMTGVRFFAEDSFDNAKFSLPATSFILPPNNRFKNEIQPQNLVTKAQNREPNFGLETQLSTSYYISDKGHFPNQQMGVADLADISALPMTHWTGVVHGHKEQNWQLHFGYDDRRQLLLMHRQFDNQKSAVLPSQTWMTFGTDISEGRFLDSIGQDGLAWGDGHSNWMNLGGLQPLLSGSVLVEYQVGKTKVAAGENCLVCGASAQFYSWRTAYRHHLSTLPDRALEIAISQPLHITQLDLSFAGANVANLHVKPRRPEREISLGLTSAGSENQFQLSYHLRPNLSGSIPHPASQSLNISWQYHF